MKPTEKATLIAVATGVAVGVVICLAGGASPWWAPVAIGFVSAAGVHTALIKSMAESRIADGE
ncbi:hypothetical protein SAMN05216255_4448 [Pseudomonas segetis]|uniref:Uncharacterized protein n=1 Tax=Pseudomonas segetis TaxID=298908 RepID=A0A239JQK1_9PSED|nr:hypothetical protein SAMN05216255_4448 [Pseudomonas segetis]